jgi:hypothetical protein
VVCETYRWTLAFQPILGPIEPVPSSTTCTGATAVRDPSVQPIWHPLVAYLAAGMAFGTSENPISVATAVLSTCLAPGRLDAAPGASPPRLTLRSLPETDTGRWWHAGHAFGTPRLEAGRMTPACFLAHAWIVKVDPKHVLEHARLADEIENLTCELGSLGAQTEALARATELLCALGGRLDQALPMTSAHGQAMIYCALLTVAYIGGTGKGRGKINSIRSLQTVAEARILLARRHQRELTSKI